MNQLAQAINLTLGHDYNSFIGLRNTFGVGREAERLKSLLGELFDDLFRANVTFGENYASVNDDLNEILDFASEDNWDGYGAKEVDVLSFLFAQTFLENLPTSYPKPEVSIDPDGEISFEWLNKYDKIFSISFNQKYEISFAGIYSTGEDHGTEEFNGYEIPKKILENIKRLYT